VRNSSEELPPLPALPQLGVAEPLNDGGMKRAKDELRL
jgi:hypothetical protein